MLQHNTSPGNLKKSLPCLQMSRETSQNSYYFERHIILLFSYHILLVNSLFVCLFVLLVLYKESNCSIHGKALWPGRQFHWVVILTLIPWVERTVNLFRSQSCAIRTFLNSTPTLQSWYRKITNKQINK